MSKEDIDKAVKEAEQFAEEDKKNKEAVDTKNNAESLVFQCEKTLGEFGDKVSADEKANIEAKINLVKEALKTDDTADIKAKSDDLQKAFYDVSSKVYQAAGAAQQAAGAAGAGPDMSNFNSNDNSGNGGNDDGVVDADFTEA